MTDSACTSPSSVALPPKRGCEFSKAGAARSRSAEKRSAMRSDGPAAHSIVTPVSSISSASSPASARCAGSTNSSPPSSRQQHATKKENPTMGENSTAVRVAIVGVGNCASSLVQGVEYYKDADAETTVPGLMHVEFGSYHVRDVQFVAAFDVDAKKVGFDLSEAILASENNTIKIADVPPL